ncbi:DUF5514 family protein [Bacillus toyonensis]|uniref:DUF5514 family protein n=1 Tax=Bacillus toyonensis TaxID=155322 RepID=UPI001C0BC06F|nr:DUF5514 family protein [Bacillus toyonensis]MBU4642990.1 DUF5514 family protein [Bacillus toyonensis]
MTSKLQNEVVAFHEYLSGIRVDDLKENEYLFNFVPKLFLPGDWFYLPLDIRLEIEGIDIPGSIVVNRPYPNQLYVVAGFDKDDGITSHGFYWIRNKEELLHNPIEITLHWYIDNKKKITHKINLSFQFGEQKGQFFSSNQWSIDLTSQLQGYELKTDISKINLTDDEITMHDEMSLTHFPIETHHCFGSDSNKILWESRKRKAAIKEKNVSHVYYSIYSSAVLSWNQKTKSIIRDFLQKNEEHFFSVEDDDYEGYFSMEFKKNIEEESDESWLVTKIIEIAEKYGITEFEVWKKYEGLKGDSIGIGLCVEEQIENYNIYLEGLDFCVKEDWNLPFDN